MPKPDAAAVPDEVKALSAEELRLAREFPRAPVHYSTRTWLATLSGRDRRIEEMEQRWNMVTPWLRRLATVLGIKPTEETLYAETLEAAERLTGERDEATAKAVRWCAELIGDYVIPKGEDNWETAEVALRRRWPEAFK